MELFTGHSLKISQSEIEESILNMVFKHKPELRPSGTNIHERVPQVSFKIDLRTGITAIVSIEIEAENRK